MRSKNNKWVSTILIILVIFALTIPAVILAQEGYEPLAPIPGIEQPEGTDFTAYFSGWIKIIIGIAGVLAVIVITVAGVEYITAGDSESRTSEAKDKIWRAIFGLLLAIAAYLILVTINPQLLKTKLELEQPEPPVNPNGYYVIKANGETAEGETCYFGNATKQIDSPRFENYTSCSDYKRENSNRYRNLGFPDCIEFQCELVRE